MKMNRRGMTLVEIIVSIVLISIVLMFLMNLFVKVRGTYNSSMIKADYDMLVATTLKAIGNDIEDYGLQSIEYERDEDGNVVEDAGALIFTFNSFRSTNLSERIVKVLRVYFDRSRNKYYLSYAYEAKYTEGITSIERATAMSRQIPDEALLDVGNYIHKEEIELDDDVLVKMKIPLSDEYGNVYDINIYGMIKGDGV